MLTNRQPTTRGPITILDEPVAFHTRLDYTVPLGASNLVGPFEQRAIVIASTTGAKSQSQSIIYAYIHPDPLTQENFAYQRTPSLHVQT